MKEFYEYLKEEIEAKARKDFDKHFYDYDELKVKKEVDRRLHHLAKKLAALAMEE